MARARGEKLKRKRAPVVLTRKLATAQAAASKALRKALTGVKPKRAKARLRIVKQKNGNVVADLTFHALRQSAKSVLLQVGQKVKAPKNTWVSTGFKFDQLQRPPGARPGDYKRSHGSYQVFLHPSRAAPNIQTQFLRAQDVLTNMKRGGHRKPKHVVIRMIWTPEGKKP